MDDCEKNMRFEWLWFFLNGILMIISWDRSFKGNGMFQDIPGK
jgi:hypothetical protein